MRSIIWLFGQLLSPTARRFHRSLEHPAQAQTEVRSKICNLLVRSEYGKSLGIKSVDDWERVPIIEYEDIRLLLNSLTPEPILFYEKTSGSRSAAKLIPYTRSIKQSFSSMFCVWTHDLIQHGPKFSTGKSYFCVSPQIDSSNSGSNAGMVDDSEYLDRWLQILLKPFLVSVTGIDRLQTAEAFKQKLCLALLEAENLEIISIWSPSFLQVQLDYIQSHRTELVELLRDRISDRRLQLLMEQDIPWTKIWQKLKLISCWDSATAADRATNLRSIFPNVMVQGKGLLATEAPITVPLIVAAGCVPVLDQVYFEFEDLDRKIHLLHELEIGQTYAIVLSQKGGLYRYRIGDRIRVTHYYLNTPCLEFLGRTDVTSDLVGEKLHEDFVRDVLDRIPEISGSSFQSLVPVQAKIPHYVLLLDRINHDNQIDLDKISIDLDRALAQSHHYNLARMLGQLNPVEIIVSPRIPQAIGEAKIRSQKWGDIKHQILSHRPISPEFLATLKDLMRSDNLLL